MDRIIIALLDGMGKLPGPFADAARVIYFAGGIMLGVFGLGELFAAIAGRLS